VWDGDWHSSITNQTFLPVLSPLGGMVTTNDQQAKTQPSFPMCSKPTVWDGDNNLSIVKTLGKPARF